jgi:feruloyl esterase
MMLKKTTIFSGLILVLTACSEQPSEQAAAPAVATPVAMQTTACEDLAAAEFALTTISSAENVAAGDFTAPAGGFGGFGPDYSGLPAFCRVVGSIHPTEDSDIRFELWLPAENWNGRFMQTGNGGVAGNVVHSSLVDPLMRGYAVANTDTGHSNGGANIYGWAVGHPEKFTDFAWRAVHELTVTGKAITTARYGRAPELNYFVGCSTGGRQGLMEAQRFPDDYDAIVAGAPAANWSPLMALALVIQNNFGAGKLLPAKIPLLKSAAIAACDALDGVEDQVISAIAQCTFDPADLLCEGEANAQCLAPEELAAAQTMYAGVVGTDGTVWFPGTGAGSEQLWLGYTSPQFSLGSAYFKDIIMKDQNWDPSTFNADDHMPPSMGIGAEIIAMNPDLSAFFGNGGKLITYHGTYDGLISYGNTLNYVNDVIFTLGEQAFNDGMRYYQVPGMSHCAGGEGAGNVDWLSAMEAWVEEGNAPGTLLGTHPAPPPGFPGSENAMGEFTRPTCAWPEVPVYDGSGDPMDAASFSCQAP